MANPYTQAISEAKGRRRSDIKAANSLASKPKLIEVKYESRQTRIERARLGDSIEEILDRAHAMGFITESDIKEQLRSLSSLLNSPRTR